MLNKIFKKEKHNFESLFYPKSIAVIGASNDTSKIGGYIFSEILKTKNIKVYPINVKWARIQEIRAYTNVSHIDSSVDLAIIAIPSSFVIEAVKDCANTGIKNIVIITAGFKEIGDVGIERENELKKIIKINDLNVIGPNCLGFLNAEINLNCSFAKDIPEFGETALISQSGAVIDAIIDWSFKKKIGFSKVVSLGNMAGISELSILEYLKQDPKTTSVVFYMETLEKGEKFAEVLKEISKKKPVIIIKPGNSKNAKDAIGSHTGSLAQNNVLVKTLIEGSNGILVEDLDELFNTITALKIKYFKDIKKNIAILTNAGGPGVIATDSVDKTNFNLYKFSISEKQEFNFLPREASVNNPIDILGDAKSDRYENALFKLGENKNIQNILILLTPQIMTDSRNIAKSIIKFSSHSKKSLGVCFLGEKEVKSAIELLDKNNIATFSTPSRALNAMNKISIWKNYNYENSYKSYKFDTKKINSIRMKLVGKKGLLDFSLTKTILEEVLAINVPEKIVIKDFMDIEKIKLDESKKYVLKADAPEFIHKKELGGVELGITHTNFKEKAHSMFDRLFEKCDNFSITIEEQVSGIETIIGLKSDKELGNFIMFGAGGTYVSVFKDINWAKCPLSEESGNALVKRSKIYTILNGFRGSKKIQFDHLYEILIRLSHLQELIPEIKEVDFNPVIASEKGIYLVDIKLIC